MAEPPELPARSSIPAATSRIGAKAQIEVAQLDLLKSLGVDAKDVVTELIRSAANNPLMGVVVAIITANVLQRAKIIDGNTAGLVMGVATAAFGISAVGTIIQDATGVIALIEGKSTGNDPAELIKPVASTVVYPTHPNSVTYEQPHAPPPTDRALASGGEGLLPLLAKVAK